MISGCNTPTENLSAFVDHHLKPLVTSIPSYVKDSNDFLNELHGINTLPEGAMLMTLDVVGLYPHLMMKGLTPLGKLLTIGAILK